MRQPFLMKSAAKVWLIALLSFAVIGLNLADVAATLYWAQLGVDGTNPFMNYIVQYDSGLFIALRTLGVTAATVFLIYWTTKRYAIAYYGLIFLALVYLLPLAIHGFIYTHTTFL